MMTGALCSPAQMLGYVALVLGVSAFLQKSDTRLKALIAAESLVYVAHFILLGNFPASGSALVSCLRMLVSLKSRSSWWLGAFLVVSFAIGLAFAKGAAGWLPVAASCLATVAVFRLQGVVMRSVLLVCTLLWLVNNILSGSVGGTVLESIIALINLTTVARLIRETGMRPGRGAQGLLSLGGDCGDRRTVRGTVPTMRGRLSGRGVRRVKANTSVAFAVGTPPRGVRVSLGNRPEGR